MRHQLLATDLVVYLRRVAERRGMVIAGEAGVFDPAITEPLHWSYRVPDLVMATMDRLSERGVEGAAALVVEVLSPDDESREKIPFYARVGVRELWLIHPFTRAFELYELRERELVPRNPEGGVFRSPVLDLAIEVIAGSKLRLTDGDDTVEI
jgi:Uma2 family endonuclease